MKMIAIESPPEIPKPPIPDPTPLPNPPIPDPLPPPYPPPDPEPIPIPPPSRDPETDPGKPSRLKLKTIKDSNLVLHRNSSDGKHVVIRIYPEGERQ